MNCRPKTNLFGPSCFLEQLGSCPLRDSSSALNNRGTGTMLVLALVCVCFFFQLRRLEHRFDVRQLLLLSLILPSPADRFTCVYHSTSSEF